jgi:hypothetical protein
MRKSICASLAVGLALVGAASTAFASVVVMESRIPSLKRGDELTDDKNIDVPFGQRLLVAVPQNGELRTVEIKGPRKGKVKDLLSPESISTRLLRMAREFALTGGTNLGSTAAARGARVLVNHVPVIEQSTICVEQGSLPLIALVPGLSKATLHVIDARNSQQARMLELSDQAPRIAWPTTVTLRDSGMYQILEEGQSRIDLTVKFVPNGTLSNPAWIRSLETLEKAGCEEQLRAAMRAIFQKGS